MRIKFIKFCACNQWKNKGLSECGVNFINIGFNRDAAYSQGHEYTAGLSLLGFACGINFMILHKDT